LAYTVLARALRPRLFDDLVGQDSIVRILKNTISEKRIAHAYLFSGPRGVGKTSSARILARAVNCTNIAVDNPCNVCPNCVSSLEGSSIDVIEIDGASNNSVDDIRDLRETVKYAPSGAKYKVYIIDEAHMLSTSAFNALLKTLEEPPSHVIFILATTAPSKILTTVLSRCQHLPFRRISSQHIVERLKTISESENIKITPEALKLISVAADGSMRDSLTLLDQICSFSSDITESDVRAMLGISDDTPVMTMALSLINGDRKMILKVIEGMYESGIELRNFISELVKYIRDALVTKITTKDDVLVGYSESKIEMIKDIAVSNSVETLTVLLNELINAEVVVRTANSQRIALEMSMIRISFINVIRPINEIMDEIRSHKGTILPQKETAKIEDIPQIVMDEQEHEPEIESVPSHIIEESNDVEKLWSVVLKELESSDYKLFYKLSDKETQIDDKSINIIFAEKDVHIDSVSKQKKTIVDIIKNITGRDFLVNVIKKKGESSEDAVPTKRNKNLDEALSDPIIIDALDLFDGRIVTVKNRK
jgi:DNA polymerase-3 subunit gamma/tau